MNRKEQIVNTAFLDACTKGNLEVVKTLVEKYAKPKPVKWPIFCTNKNSKPVLDVNYMQGTPLVNAIENRHEAVVEYLLAQPLQKIMISHNCNMPFLTACLTGQTQIAQNLLDFFCNKYAKIENIYEGIRYATFNKQDQTALSLLSNLDQLSDNNIYRSVEFRSLMEETCYNGQSHILIPLFESSKLDFLKSNYLHPLLKICIEKEQFELVNTLLHRCAIDRLIDLFINNLKNFEKISSLEALFNLILKKYKINQEELISNEQRRKIIEKESNNLLIMVNKILKYKDLSWLLKIKSFYGSELTFNYHLFTQCEEIVRNQNSDIIHYVLDSLQKDIIDSNHHLSSFDDIEEIQIISQNSNEFKNKLCKIQTLVFSSHENHVVIEYLSKKNLLEDNHKNQFLEMGKHHISTASSKAYFNSPIFKELSKIDLLSFIIKGAKQISISEEMNIEYLNLYLKIRFRFLWCYSEDMKSILHFAINSNRIHLYRKVFESFKISDMLEKQPGTIKCLEIHKITHITKEMLIELLSGYKENHQIDILNIIIRLAIEWQNTEIYNTCFSILKEKSSCTVLINMASENFAQWIGKTNHEIRFNYCDYFKNELKAMLYPDDLRDISESLWRAGDFKTFILIYQYIILPRYISIQHKIEYYLDVDILNQEQFDLDLYPDNYKIFSFLINTIDQKSFRELERKIIASYLNLPPDINTKPYLSAILERKFKIEGRGESINLKYKFYPANYKSFLHIIELDNVIISVNDLNEVFNAACRNQDLFILKKLVENKYLNFDYTWSDHLMLVNSYIDRKFTVFSYLKSLPKSNLLAQNKRILNTAIKRLDDALINEIMLFAKTTDQEATKSIRDYFTRKFNHQIFKSEINYKQSSHNDKIHESVSQSAIRLKIRYHDLFLITPLSDVLKSLLDLLKGYPKLNPKVDMFCLTVAKDFTNNLHDIRQELPYWNYLDPVSNVRLIELLAYLTLSLDDKGCLTCDKMTAIDNLVDALYQCARGNNMDDNDIDDRTGENNGVCPAGSFNKLIEKFNSVHIDCEMVFVSWSLVEKKFPLIVSSALKTYFNDLLLSNRSSVVQLEQIILDLKENGIQCLVPKIEDNIRNSIITEFDSLFNNKNSKDGNFKRLSDCIDNLQYLDLSKILVEIENWIMDVKSMNAKQQVPTDGPVPELLYLEDVESDNPDDNMASANSMLPPLVRIENSSSNEKEFTPNNPVVFNQSQPLSTPSTSQAPISLPTLLRKP